MDLKGDTYVNKVMWIYNMPLSSTDKSKLTKKAQSQSPAWVKWI